MTEDGVGAGFEFVQHPVCGLRQLAPFLLLSLALHVAVVVFFPLRKQSSFVVQPLPMRVSLLPESSAAHGSTGSPRTEGGRNAFPHLPYSRNETAALDFLNADAVPTSGAQHLMESARGIAREEAMQAEQAFEANEKKRLDTPLGRLKTLLRQHHTVTRLANGMVRMEGAAGAVCFDEPPPYFAWDTPNLYKIARTCP